MTNTDTQWTDRLAGVMPANFQTNMADTFSANTGYLNSMINRIGLTVINSVDTPYNPFAKYDQTTMDYGDTIQTYKTKYIPGQDFDPDNSNPYGTNKRNPIAQYFELNDSIQYEDTIQDYELAKAFTSEQKLGDFVATKLDAIYQSNGIDKFTKWKKYMSNTAIAGACQTVEIDAADELVYAENLLKKFREFANTKFRLPNTAYNVAGDLVLSPSVDIIMRSDDKNLIDEYLKGVYNLDKVRIKANIIEIDDFATVTDVGSKKPAGTGDMVALICDSREFAYYPRTPRATSIYNPKGLYTNYFLTIEGVYTAHKFRNCVQLFKASA